MYNIPPSFQNRIDEFLQGHKGATIQSYNQLSRRYHNPTPEFGFKDKTETIAYLAARMPATFSAVSHVFHQFREDFTPQSFLDLGAGPGTGAIAASLHWPSLETISLVEQDTWMVEIGEHLLKEIPQSITYRQSNITHSLNETADLVLLSYVINEWPLQDQISMVERAWKAATKALTIIVPGTPTHYQNLMFLRQWLIEQGGHIVAPCPHHKSCPLKSPDWCHFSERVARTSQHRRLKKGTLSYEDEKFSYLIVSKENLLESGSRIIRYPIKKPGHVTLDLCEKSGLSRKTISKKDKVLYAKAKKVCWGDLWKL